MPPEGVELCGFLYIYFFFFALTHSLTWMTDLAGAKCGRYVFWLSERIIVFMHIFFSFVRLVVVAIAAVAATSSTRVRVQLMNVNYSGRVASKRLYYLLLRYA